MSINSNNQQINVFNKGMNTDTSDAYLSNEQYRYAENLRFITNTGENSGELRTIEGYEKIEGLIEDGEQIIAVTSIRNLIIFLSNINNVANVHVWNSTLNVHTYPFISENNYQWDNTIKYSLVTRWESDNNIKLYIADGVHEQMSLNITMPTGYYTSIEMLHGTTADSLRPIECSKAVDFGNIRSPKVQYCYYLYTEGSGRSDLSPLSNIMTVDGVYEESSSNWAAFLRIYVNTNKFKKICIFRIEYVQNGSVPNVYIAFDGFLSGNTQLIRDNTNAITYVDKGDRTYSVSFAEFKSLEKFHIKPRIIESKENYLFAANVEDVRHTQDDKFSDVTVTYQIIDEPDSNHKYELNYYGDFASIQGGTNDKSHYGTSLMVGETYRYGFVYYTSDGQKTSVLNITDVPVPEDTQYVDSISGNGVTFKRIGVSFTLSNLPDDCIGYDVVRCERTIDDSNTITQGILGCTFGNSTRHLRYASSFMSLSALQATNTFSNELSSSGIETKSDLTMFASPESSYQMDDVVQALKTYKASLSLNEVQRYYMENAGYGLTDSHSVKSAIPITTGDSFSGEEDVWYYTHTKTNASPANYIYHNNERSVLFYYMIPKGISSDDQYLQSTVQDFNSVYSPTIFDDGQNIQIGNDVAVVNDFEFFNWDAWYFFKSGTLDVGTWPYNHDIDKDNEAYAISSGKQCILLKSGIQKITDTTEISNFPVSVVNITRTNVNPYGGNSDEAKKANAFYSFGNYFQRQSGSTNNISVYDGDVYNCMFVYNSSHTWDSAKYSSVSNTVVYSVPLQTRIDLTRRHGDLYPDLENQSCYYFLQDLAGNHGGLIQDKNAYLYNTAYSLNYTSNSFFAPDVKSIDSSKYDTRVFYSDPKTNGELIDNWTNFKVANFLDVDSRYGEITNLRLFKNNLMFWQKGAVGVLSVNERTMLQDVNDTNIILGNGDVLQRYDYLSTKYGMAPNQMCDAQSDTSLYWWDEYNRDLVQYRTLISRRGDSQVSPLKIEKTVSNLINSQYITERALLYDNKYKEILFSSLAQTYIDKHKTLVYNEIVQQFTSMYDFEFKYSADIEGNLYFFNDQNDAYIWNIKGHELKPLLKYLVNDKNMFVKVYDNVQIGMGEQFTTQHFYSDTEYAEKIDQPLTFKFHTFEQNSQINKNVTNREYDLRFSIPRNAKTTAKYSDNWGERMRGRTMQCELSSESSTDFSIQYIITKYRISWS